jgi:redox-sensitive bicupin YhaK (pirin superfamily)
MIVLRRADERQHERRSKREAWLTFSSRDPTDPFAKGFGTLETLKEGRLSPRAGIRQPARDAEIITYVREGTLAYQDSLGQPGVIRAGEFQRMTAGRGIRYSEMNASPTESAHVFQIWLRPCLEPLDPGHEEKRFTAAERRGILCAVASSDGRRGSLKLHQDAVLYSMTLGRGQHMIHELSPKRSAWLHLVHGRADFETVTLNAGDGVGISAERSLSLTARQETEILLLDLGQLVESEVFQPEATNGPSTNGHSGSNGKPQSSSDESNTSPPPAIDPE